MRCRWGRSRIEKGDAPSQRCTGDGPQGHNTAECSEKRAQRRRSARHKRSRKGRGAGRHQRAPPGRQRDRQNCAPYPSGRSPWAGKTAESEPAGCELPGEHCGEAATSPANLRQKVECARISQLVRVSHTQTSGKTTKNPSFDKAREQCAEGDGGFKGRFRGKRPTLANPFLSILIWPIWANPIWATPFWASFVQANCGSKPILANPIWANPFWANLVCVMVGQG